MIWRRMSILLGCPCLLERLWLLSLAVVGRRGASMCLPARDVDAEVPFGQTVLNPYNEWPYGCMDATESVKAIWEWTSAIDMRLAEAWRGYTEVVSILDTVVQGLFSSNRNQRFELRHSVEAYWLSLFSAPFELFLQNVENGHDIP
jgi:hypothetical protein